MEIIRIRTLWRSDPEATLRLWHGLINYGHQRFRIEDTDEPESWWIDLFLPEVLKYGLPLDAHWKWKDSFFWPWPSGEPLLRPVFKESMNRTIMFLDVNYYGIYYDPLMHVFRAITPVSGTKGIKILCREDQLRHTRILREAGIPFDVFQDNQKIWPVIDFNRPDDKYEYYFQKTSEV